LLTHLIGPNLAKKPAKGGNPANENNEMARQPAKGLLVNFDIPIGQKAR